MAKAKATKRQVKIKYDSGKKVKVKKKTGITKTVTPKGYAGVQTKRRVTKTKTGTQKGYSYTVEPASKKKARVVKRNSKKK